MNDGKIEEWKRNDKNHRDGAPAKIMRGDPLTGKPRLESWYQNGKVHRVGGPAITQFSHIDGSVMEEQWYQNDKLYREDDLPPIVVYNPDGSVLPDAMAMRRIKSSEAETKRAMEVAEKVAAALELRRRGTGARGEATQTALDDDAPLPPPAAAAAADDAK